MRLCIKLVASIVAAAALSVPASACAQELPPPPGAQELITADCLLAGSGQLGEAWRQVLSAAFESMRWLVEVEHPAVRRVVATTAFARKSRSMLVLTDVALREAAAPSRLRVGIVEAAPLVIEPFTTAADTRGEQGVLLGLQVPLPENMP